MEEKPALSKKQLRQKKREKAELQDPFQKFDAIVSLSNSAWLLAVVVPGPTSIFDASPSLNQKL